MQSRFKGVVPLFNRCLQCCYGHVVVLKMFVVLFIPKLSDFFKQHNNTLSVFLQPLNRRLQSFYGHVVVLKMFVVLSTP